MKNSEELKYRIYIIMAIMSATGLTLVAQLVRWQVVEHHRFVAMAKAEHRDEILIAPRRGEIRDGAGYLLATDIIQYDISASPKIIGNPQDVSERIAPLLDMSVEQLTETLNGNEIWVPLAKKVPRTAGESLLEWDITGIKAEARTKRIYPEGSLASHLLGFVNENGYGFYGVEGYYDTMLRGTPGYQKGERSPFGEIIPLAASDLVPPKSGPTLYLTIDRGVQHFIEEEIKRTVTMYQAERGSVVVLQPKTGRILGMANYPTYDPNLYAQTDEKLYANPTVSEQYEPGSVFKIISMAAGLDANVVLPETTLYDGGAIEIGGRVIYNWDRQSHDMVDMTDILAKSLNVGIAQLAVALNKDRFYTYIKRFGFGRLTETDLASEGPGTLKTPKDSTWHESDLGANSFGQGIAVTPLQIASAISAVANKGLLMKPYAVQRIVDDERDIEVKPVVVRRAISEQTAETLTNMLVEALDRAESGARLPGYRVAGKTGTAEIPIPGGYHPTLTLASFVGYLPANNPELVILVIIDRPTTSRWGSKTAAPTFRRIAEQLVVLLNIPPDTEQFAMND